MAPKSKTKKTSYVISGEVFNLTCWDGAIRLTESPPLIYKPQNHLLDGAQAGLVSFSNFSSILSFALIFHFNMFLDM